MYSYWFNEWDDQIIFHQINFFFHRHHVRNTCKECGTFQKLIKTMVFNNIRGSIYSSTSTANGPNTGQSRYHIYPWKPHRRVLHLGGHGFSESVSFHKSVKLRNPLKSEAKNFWGGLVQWLCLFGIFPRKSSQVQDLAVLSHWIPWLWLWEMRGLRIWIWVWLG